ncbi:MAG: alpha/beta hydrolase [Candidatus Cryptobacteroides sp.]
MKNRHFLLGLCSFCIVLNYFSGCTPDTDAIKIIHDDEIALTSEVFYGHRDGLNIYCVSYRPENALGELPTVILSHSNSLTHAAMEGYAQAIARKGFATCCFDFCGGSDKSLSDGSTDDMSLLTEIADLETILYTVKGRDYVNESRLYLLGSSLGGVVSALVAEEHMYDIAGLILFYPAFNIPELVDSFSGLMPGMGSSAFIDSVKGKDLYSMIGGFYKEVLIIQGSSDFIVPVSSSQKAAGIYPHATLQIIEGANHGFNEANLGAMGSIMLGGADYDSVVMPFVFDFLGVQE